MFSAYCGLLVCHVSALQTNMFFISVFQIIFSQLMSCDTDECSKDMTKTIGKIVPEQCGLVEKSPP